MILIGGPAFLGMVFSEFRFAMFSAIYFCFPASLFFMLLCVFPFLFFPASLLVCFFVSLCLHFSAYLLLFASVLLHCSSCKLPILYS